MEDTCTDDIYYPGYDKNIGKSDYKNFFVEGNDFFPCKDVVNELPNGYYSIRRDYTRGVFLRKKTVNLDKLVKLETYSLYNDILNDIDTFWKSKGEYTKRGRVYKRNILLYSPPGMGKTSLINLLVDDLIRNRNGFVISLTEAEDIFNYNDAMQFVRSIMPNKPIITIIEDIDNFIGDGADKKLESELLNMLDGINKHQNILTIATTNYPENLTERYLKRPSRFNRKYSFIYPNEENRREFIIKTNLKSDLDSININEWVKKTEGWTIDYIKELCDSVFINGYSEEQSFNEINDMIQKKTLQNDKPSNVKSKIGFGVHKRPENGMDIVNNEHQKV